MSILAVPISLAFDENGLLQNDIYTKLLMDKLEINQGMIVENIVAQMLQTAGHQLYFYSKASNDSNERMEIDFLIRKNKTTSRHNISPIEVKSGMRYTTTSLNKLIKKFSPYLSTPYIIHSGDLSIEEPICYLPYYMVPLL